MSAKPDAVLIAGSGTPAALPQKTLDERGSVGTIYQRHGVANNDFLRMCGKGCEGTLLPAGPVPVADRFNRSRTDHLGLDRRAAVMVEIENGAWRLAR